jgi:hypothetical protein
VPQTPADLLAHQVIYEQRDGGATWAFRQGTSETTVTVSGRLRVSAGEGIREGVLAGLISSADLADSPTDKARQRPLKSPARKRAASDIKTANM